MYFMLLSIYPLCLDVGHDQRCTKSLTAVKDISLERVFCYLQGNNSINVLKWKCKTFLCLEEFPYFKVLLEAGTTVIGTLM